MKEPKRDDNMDNLVPYVAERFWTLYKRMRARGFDPVLFEGRRSKLRQLYLYGYGRTHHRDQPKRTWTLLSRHIPGKAADTVSETRWWDWPEFFTALIEEGAKLGLHPAGKSERCHLQWNG